jgi:hypothetical protein
VAELRRENERLRSQVCSHATGPHNQSCDLVAGHDKEKKLLRGRFSAMLHFLTRKLKHGEDWDKEIREEIMAIKLILWPPGMENEDE